MVFFPSGGSGRTHFSPACCRTLVGVDHWFSRLTPPDLGGGLVARRGAHSAPAVDCRMTRENPFRRPAGGGCHSVQAGPGAASIGGLSCVLLRRAGQSFPRFLPAAPVNPQGVRGRAVCGLRAAQPPGSPPTALPRRLFRPFLAGQKWAPVPRFSFFVFRLWPFVSRPP